MRSPEILLGTLFSLVAAAGPTGAQAPNPVAWVVKTAPHGNVKPGSKFAVSVVGTVQTGWHLYAMEEPDGGPIATQVGLAEGDPASVLRVSASKPQTIHDDALQLDTGVYLTTAEFTLSLKAATAPSHDPLHVLVRYQTCNNKVCLPPRTQTIEVPVRIGQ